MSASWRANRPGTSLSMCMAMLAGLAAALPARAAAPSPVLPDMMDEKTVKAIDRGLEYLRNTQRQADGSWLNSGGYGYYPSVMTSLAAMAMMANGSTAETGPYARQITRGMNYVLRCAENQDDGLIAGPGAEYRSMYGHGFSMLFLAQCYGMEVSKDYETRIKKVLDKAVLLTAKAQSNLGKGSNYAGGWYYTPSSGSDEGSVTVTQLQALRACRNVGIKIPTLKFDGKDLSPIERAVAYLKHCQEPDGGICYSASSRGGSRPAISAAGIACFYAAGVYDRASGGGGKEAEMVERLVAYCKSHAKVDQSDGHWFYTHFYMAQAMYHRGGADWKNYYPQIRNKLLSMQSIDGSWNGDGVGTTYGTAMACIILQLPYGYLPICQK